MTKSHIARDTKQFETNLKAKSDTAIERLRSDLQIRSIEHQVRFSRLHEKRALVWAGEPSKEEKHQTAMNKLVEFFRYFDKHRIYLPETLCVSLEAIAMRVRSHVIEFGVFARFNDQSLNENTRRQKEDAWNKGWEAIKNDIPRTRKQLEEEFRSLLGVA